MNLNTWDYVILVSLSVLIVSVGLSYSNKASKNLLNFFLGGRNLTWYTTGISMVATTFAADTPLAVTELVSKNGIAGNWLWWNMLAGGMLTTFFFAKYWHRSEVLTDLELIEIRYSGKSAKFLRGFRAIYFGVFMNCIIIGWVNLALMALLEVFFNIQSDYLIYYVALALVIVSIYTSISGILGVIYTDVIQFIIAMIGSIVLAIMVLNDEKIGGISNLKSNLPEGTLSFFPSINEADSTNLMTLGIGSFFAFIVFQWWTSWYPGNEPGGGGYIAQRMMSTKSEKHAFYSVLFFQIAHYCIRPWPWILVALSSLVLYPDFDKDQSKLGYVMVMKEFLPTGLKGLVLFAFFAAYMSTISTQLNWGTSYLINDVYIRFINKNASQKKYIKASRIGTIVIMVISLIVTNQISSISEVWSFIIECGAGLGLVMILRWYWWRINAWSEIIASISPFIALIICKNIFARYDSTWGMSIIENPKAFFFTVFFTTISWIIGTFITKPTEHKKLQSFFNKIMPDGNWSPFRKTWYLNRIGILFICWICSICFAYSILFLLGYLIFQEWNYVLISISTTISSLLLLKYFSNKVSIF